MPDATPEAEPTAPPLLSASIQYQPDAGSIAIDFAPAPQSSEVSFLPLGAIGLAAAADAGDLGELTGPVNAAGGGLMASAAGAAATQSAGWHYDLPMAGGFGGSSGRSSQSVAAAQQAPAASSMPVGETPVTPSFDPPPSVTGPLASADPVPPVSGPAAPAPATPVAFTPDSAVTPSTTAFASEPEVVADRAPRYPDQGPHDGPHYGGPNGGPHDEHGPDHRDGPPVNNFFKPVIDDGDGGPWQQVALNDEVHVPEPGSMALLVGGLSLLALRRRRTS